MEEYDVYLLFFIQYVKYKIRHPVRTTLAVSNSTDSDICRELTYSIKYVQSLENDLLDSERKQGFDSFILYI